VATRLYFPDSTAPAVSPTFGSMWEDTGLATRHQLVQEPTGTALVAPIDATKNSTAQPSDQLFRQYVSEPFNAAGSIGGTFSMVIGARETNTAYNAWLQVRISVVSGDGLTERGVLYAGQTQATESAVTTDPHYEFGTGTATGSRYLSGVSLDSVTVSSGDRLVVELGARLRTATTGSNLARLRFGDPVIYNDLPLLPDEPTSVGRPWIEFSDTLPLPAPPANLTMDGTITPPTGAIGVWPQPEPVGTGDAFPDDGIDLGGDAVVEFDGPVASPPATAAPLARDVAYVIDAVDLTAGLVPTVTERHQVKPMDRHRVIVGGTDVTYLRGATTPMPTYQLLDPWSYGTATLTFPQIVPCYEPEQLGVGDLAWCVEGAAVKIQRVDPTANTVVATDWRGFVAAININGGALTLTLAGEALGRATNTWQPTPIYHAERDLGRHIWGSIALRCHLPFSVYGGPVTGVRRYRDGGMWVSECVNGYLAETQLVSGARRTLRFDETTRRWDIPVKDTVTVAATVYLDKARYVSDLASDLSEKPNQIYGNAVTVNGQRFNNAKAPNLRVGDPVPYPMTGGTPFGQGTVDGDTDSGSGITAMIHRLAGAGYLEFLDAPGGYDADATSAIRALQRDAGLNVTGVMNPATWDALWDTDITGFTWTRAGILPMAERSQVRKWNYSATGAVLARNPSYDPDVVVVSRAIDFPPGFTKQQVRAFTASELWDGQPMWTGSIDVVDVAVVRGTHNPGDPLDPADVMNVRELRPGTNLWLPTFQGGTLVHLVAVDVQSPTRARLTVDTHARDAAEVWEIISRNRESRRSRHRAWLADYRGSMRTKDSTTGWLDFAGIIEGDGVTLKGKTWNVFLVPAGEEGSIRRQRYRTNPNAEFCVALFGREVTVEALNRRIPKPLTDAEPWENPAQREWLEDRVWLDAYGTPEQPCGWWPTKKAGGVTAATFTGNYEHQASVEFHTFNRQAALWVAVWPDRDTVIPPGRIWWPLLEDGI